MNVSLFSLCANIFGFMMGGLSLLGFVIAICRPHLPSNKIKTLEMLLHETEHTFKEAIEAELLVSEFIERTEDRLALLREQTRTFGARAYSATTLSQDFAEFLRGTSGAMGRICQSLKKLRAEVITSSQERRHRLMQTNSEQTPPPPSYPMTQPTPTPPAIIRRPNSCPPVLPIQHSDCVRNVPIDIGGSIDQLKIIGGNHPDESSSASDPFSDSSRSDSDVRTVGVQHRT